MFLKNPISRISQQDVAMKFGGLYCMAAALGMASAHTLSCRTTVGSTTYQQAEGIYMPSNDRWVNDDMSRARALCADGRNKFIDDVTSASLACIGPPITGFMSSSTKLSVQAGETVSSAWLHTLTST
jgi:cellulase